MNSSPMSSRRSWCRCLVAALLWLWVIAHLRDEWTLNSQYNYGWGVPFLAALLFYLRWTDRPPKTVDGTGRPGLFFAFEIALLLMLLPVRMIEEANRDWRLLGWALAACAVGYSLVTMWRIGGRTWIRHFAFPICFPLVAVPWPVQLENFVVQNLARGVATVAVEIAGWIGIGAYQLGNVIELPNGFVGVDDACSGVKTLQAAIMVTLFFGELLRLRTSQRLALVALGCAWMFVCNIARATTLVILAANHGTAAVTRWHDLVGTVVLIGGMLGVVTLAMVLRGKSTVGEAVSIPPRSSTAATTAPQDRQSLGLAAFALVWLALVFAGTELWYRSHERELVARPAWAIDWTAANEKSLRTLEIPDETRAILHYDEASSATWQDAGGVKWWGFFARWKPQRAALQLVRSHSPEICLPAVGRTFIRELPAISVPANHVDLRFRVYEFEQHERPLFVFVAIQEDKAGVENAPPLELSARGRLRAAFNGQRNLGQRLLEIAVIGFDDFPQAREALMRAVPGLIVG